MKTLHLLIIVFSFFALSMMSTSSFAPCPMGVTSCGPPPGVTVSAGTDSPFYEKNDTITINGILYSANDGKTIPIQILNPLNKTVGRYNVAVDYNNKFSLQVKADFNTTGQYHMLTCFHDWCDNAYFKYVAEPYKLSFNGMDFLIKYKSYADLAGIEVDLNNQALRVHVANATSTGQRLVLELTRALIDSKSARGDENFTVLVGQHQPDKYMQVADFKEIASSDVSRTLAIDIPYDPIANAYGIWDYKITAHDVLQGLSVFTGTPIQQFKSGIKAKDVKCEQDLHLVIKSEDGSPACVKPEHLARLAQYGWTIPNLKITGDTDITNNGVLSESNCGQFYTIPENKSDFNEIPVLILKQNSTGCAKITFTVNFLFNSTNHCIGCNSLVKIGEFLSIGKYNFSRHGDLISGSPGKDYTHSFQITAVPNTIDLANFPVGSNFTVIFIIKPLPNATGFYDYSIAKPVCNAYPLAVGYSLDQVNSSDFSEDLGFMQNHPCVMGPYGISPVQISGMNYVQMKLS